MEENRNKVTMNIITIVIIAVAVLLIIGTLVTIIIVNNIKKPNSGNISNEIVNQDKEQFDNTDDKVNTDKTDITNDDTTDEDDKTDDKTTDDTNKSDVPKSDIKTKESSKESPLALGEWGVASKYSSGNYKAVPVSVTKITRGSEAEQKVKDYCNKKGSIYKYEDPKEGMEWVVVDYKVDLSSVMTSSGVSIKVDSKVRGAGSSNSIKYNGMTYIVTTKDMSSSSYTKNNMEDGSFLVQLPKGYTNYVILMGTTDHETAYFKGE